MTGCVNESFGSRQGKGHLKAWRTGQLAVALQEQGVACKSVHGARGNGGGGEGEERIFSLCFTKDSKRY